MVCRLDPNTTTYYASKQGRAHVANNTVCQDYSLADNIDNDCQVVCVADGHGSKEYIYSDVGAKLACELFVEMVRILKEGYEKAGVSDWMEHLKTAKFKSAFIQMWRKKVIEDYERREENVSEVKLLDLKIIRKYGTTFLFAICYRNKIVLGQLGDGAILMGFSEDGTPEGNWQLFKRHGLKYNSITNSMASNTAEYTFLIDSFERDNIAYLLLSTDGIYDCLDQGDAFFQYAQALIEQIHETKALDRPFHLDDETDVSRYTGDDCSIALMLFGDAATGKQTLERQELEQLGYWEVKCERFLKNLRIYTAIDSEGEEVELHVTPYEAEANIPEGISEKVLLPKALKKLEAAGFLYVYRKSDLDRGDRLSILFEQERQTEKRYCLPGRKAEEPEYSNSFWLSVLEELMAIRRTLKQEKAAVTDELKECLIVTQNDETKTGKVFLLADGLKDRERRRTDDKLHLRGMDRILESIGIVGVIRCGNRNIPIYRSACHRSQSIPMLHTDLQEEDAETEDAGTIDTGSTLARCIYRQDRGYGLWNGSGVPWKLKEGKIVPAGKTLRLNTETGNEFRIPTDDEAVPELGIWDSCATYEARLYQWEE